MGSLLYDKENIEIIFQSPEGGGCPLQVHLGEHEWCSGRALASHQCGPGSNPGVDVIMCFEFVVGSLFAPRGFSSGTPVFPSP